MASALVQGLRHTGLRGEPYACRVLIQLRRHLIFFIPRKWQGNFLSGLSYIITNFANNSFPSLLSFFLFVIFECGFLAIMATAAQRQMLMRRDVGTGGDPNAAIDRDIQTVLGVSAFSIVLATVPVTLRFLSRRSQNSSFKADDWLIVIALARPSKRSV